MCVCVYVCVCVCDTSKCSGKRGSRVLHSDKDCGKYACVCENRFVTVTKTANECCLETVTKTDENDVVRCGLAEKR